MDVNSTIEKIECCKKSLEGRIDSTTDYEGLKAEILYMSQMVGGISDSLPNYDLQRYSSAIDQLLKKVNTKANAVSTKQGQKRFQFKKKPEIRSKNAQDTNLQQTALPVADTQYICGQDFELDGSRNIFENLRDCTISSKVSTPNLPSSSLQLRNLHSCVVSLDKLPFRHGSIFVENCEACVLILVLDQQDDVQIRLHSLSNCRLYIKLNGHSDQKQDVVIENCKGCIFHEDTVEKLLIQDFSHLQLQNSADSQSYNPGRFGIFDCNIASLRVHYIDSSV